MTSPCLRSTGRPLMKGRCERLAHISYVTRAYDIVDSLSCAAMENLDKGSATSGCRRAFCTVARASAGGWHCASAARFDLEAELQQVANHAPASIAELWL